MFDFLKKKISGFIDGITKKEEAKPEIKPDLKEPEEEEILEQIEEKEIKTVEKPVQKIEKKKEKPAEIISEIKKPEIKKEAPKIESPEQPEKKLIEKKEMPKPTIETTPKIQEPEKKITEKIERKIEPEQKPKIEITVEQKKEPTPKIEERKTPRAEGEETKQKEEEKPKERIKLGIVSAVKSIITREVKIEEKDVKEMLDSFELELMEADVDITVAESIRQDLREKMVGSKIGKNELHSFISGSIKDTLVDVLTNEKRFTIEQRMESSEKPLKIMFLGINGAGKTTTIAKVAKKLINQNKKVVFAAADTFRAAAIEQMSVHADRLGVKVIKREYGSDPTSVAFDAVNYGKAHGIDAVLIDTAGRQDTNVSLMNEMKKMNRVIQPDIKIYIGESIAGNAIIEQISAFNREIGVDAVILTKLDCDPKGGTMLSINKTTGIPIVYVGVGQGYDDLEEFDPKKIAERIVE